MMCRVSGSEVFLPLAFENRIIRYELANLKLNTLGIEWYLRANAVRERRANEAVFVSGYCFALNHNVGVGRYTNRCRKTLK